MLIGIFLAGCTALGARAMAAECWERIPALTGNLVLLCGGALWLKPMNVDVRFAEPPTASLVMGACLTLGNNPYGWTAYDIRPISAKIKGMQDAGVPVANDGKYYGHISLPDV